MTALDASFYGEPDRRDFIRWAASLLVVLALHAVLVAALLTRSEPVEVADVSPPAIFMDLPPPEPLPEPAAPTAEPAPPTPIAEEPPPPPSEAVPKPDAPPQPEPEPQPEQQVEAEPRKLAVPVVPEVTEAPVPRPPPPKPQPPRREAPPRQNPPQPPAEPQRAMRTPPARPAEPPRGLSLRLQPTLAPPPGLPSQTPPVSPDIPYQPGSSTRTSAVESFQKQLIAHLARYKQYPRISQIRREQGVVRVRFTMDADGYVLSTTILKSSGYAALDDEVEALLKRAQPLPPLPRESGLSRFQVEMPVQFYVWQRE